MATAAVTSVESRRIEVIDLARGLALVAMTIFHFCWDLAMFRLIEPAFMVSFSMVLFARSIAGSFLFLVGFSLYLAHGEGIRWQAFAIRLAVIVAAALLITTATYFLMQDGFIYFGILHCIAVSSLLGLAFLGLPWPVIIAASAFFFFGAGLLASPEFEAPVWWWTGLSAFSRPSNDFVPIFPFFGAVLLGIAAAQIASRTGLLSRLSDIRCDIAPARAMLFIGRHSLAYYLIHQPILIALLATALWIIGRI